jgi:cytochrome P450
MPPGHWLLGHLPQRARDSLRLFRGSRDQLGDVVRYRMVTLYVEQLTHPDHVRRVLVDAKDTYGKGETWDKTKPLVGQGLLTAEGALWRQQRRLAQPAFHAEQLSRLTTIMTGTITEQLAGWDAAAAAGTPLLIFDEMRELALKIVVRSLFGTELDDQLRAVMDDFTAALQVTNRRILSPFAYRPRLYRVPTPGNRAFRRHVAALDTVVNRIVAGREDAGGTGRHDLLDLLLEATRSEVGTIDRRQLRDEMMTLLLAGSETTANALCWALDLLHDHPDVAAVLVAEADQALAGRTPTAADLTQLPYARAVVDEVLRLYPPVWALPRVALQDDEIDGYRIPQGDLVILVPYVTHRHPDFWVDPDAFDPERFLPERRKIIPRGAYFPFGAGQRQCLGIHFAIMEAQLVLIMVAQRFRLTKINSGPEPPDPQVTLRPRTSMPMHVHRRS